MTQPDGTLGDAAEDRSWWKWPVTAWEWVCAWMKNYWLFVLALLLYAGSYVYQSGTVLRDASLQQHEIIRISPQTLEMSVTYPQRLRVDNGQIASVVITLRHNQPVSPTLAYTVDWIMPPEAIIITNQDGEHIGGRFVLTPTMQYPTSVTFNMRRVLSTKAALPPLSPILLVQTPTELLTTRVLPVITTPSLWEIWWLGFWNLVFGPATPLISAAAGLMVLAVKKIQDLANRRQKDVESRQRAEAELSQWKNLLKTNLSEGARQYVQFRRRNKEELWEPDGVGRQELQRIWEQQDSHLRDAVACLEFPSDQQHESANLVLALEWAEAKLDEEWRVKAYIKLLQVGHPESEERLFENILRIWPQFIFWRQEAPRVNLASPSAEILVSLTTMAEQDGLWFEAARIEPSWFKDFHEPNLVWAYGPPGCGKTSAAIGLLHKTCKNLPPSADRSTTEFYVYCPFTRIADIANLEDIARAVAQTLLHYFALDSAAFLRLDWRAQHTLIQLWRQYAGPDVRAALYAAGCSPYGERQNLLERVNALQTDTSLVPLPLDHLPGRLFNVCPPSFTRLTLLLDVLAPPTTLTESMQDALLQLGEALQQAGIGVKILTLGDSLDIELPRWWHSIKLTWTESDLSTLLKGLKIDPLDSWCNPDARKLSAETRLLAAAQGTPRGLLQKLIELQQCMERNNAPLSAQDLDDILGPAPTIEEIGNV